jgi:hypothetical protein
VKVERGLAFSISKSPFNKALESSDTCADVSTSPPLLVATALIIFTFESICPDASFDTPSDPIFTAVFIFPFLSDGLRTKELF